MLINFSFKTQISQINSMKDMLEKYCFLTIDTSYRTPARRVWNLEKFDFLGIINKDIKKFNLMFFECLIERLENLWLESLYLTNLNIEKWFSNF